MLGLPFGPNLNPSIEHCPSPSVGERIRFALVRLEAPRQEYSGLE